jgi:hypothetical protein
MTAEERAKLAAQEEDLGMGKSGDARGDFLSGICIECRGLSIRGGQA